MIIAPCMIIINSTFNVSTMKNQSKLRLVTLFFMLAATQLNAQDRIKEAGLTFRNLDNFGLNYKTGTQQSLWRFGSMYASGYSQKELSDNNGDVDQSSNGLGFRIGREYRKEIIEALQFRIGFDLSFTWSKQEYKSTYADGSISQMNSRNTYGPGANGVIGLNYVVKDKFLIGAEIMPGFGYSFGSTTQQYMSNPEIERDLSGWNYDLSSSSAVLTLAFRFVTN
jgi:hypothetical protein